MTVTNNIDGKYYQKENGIRFPKLWYAILISLSNSVASTN